MRYEFVTLAKKRFFGYVEENTTGGTFNISSREKTIIDCMLYPKYCGGLDEAVKGICKSRQELDFVKLLEYSKRLGVTGICDKEGTLVGIITDGDHIWRCIIRPIPVKF